MADAHDPRVVCAGIVVADVFVPPLARLPDPGALVATDDFVVETGGCAANAAIALARLGLRPTIVARVGDDLFGEFVRDELVAAGVDVTHLSRDAVLGTSKTVIVPVEGEDRRYIHTFGANAALSAADLAPALAVAPDVLYIGGFLVLPGLRQAELAEHVRAARQAGTRVVFDVVAPAGRPVSLDDVGAVLPEVDYFVPNDDEAAALTGESDPKRQAQALLALGVGTVVITLGERGLVAATRDETIELPAPQIELVEPSGAGDAFAAGLVYGVLRGGRFGARSSSPAWSAPPPAPRSVARPGSSRATGLTRSSRPGPRPSRPPERPTCPSPRSSRCSLMPARAATRSATSRPGTRSRCRPSSKPQRPSRRR